MDWLQVFTIAATTIGACWWMHHENILAWKESAKETKEFHGRLCALEEKYTQMMERFLEEKNRK